KKFLFLALIPNILLAMEIERSKRRLEIQEVPEKVKKARIDIERLKNELLASIRVEDLEAVKQLIKGGAPVNFSGSEGETPLYIAAETGNLDIARYLIERGAYLSETPLYIAIKNNDWPLINYLVRVYDRDVAIDAVLPAGNLFALKYMIEKFGIYRDHFCR